MTTLYRTDDTIISLTYSCPTGGWVLWYNHKGECVSHRFTMPQDADGPMVLYDGNYMQCTAKEALGRHFKRIVDQY